MKANSTGGARRLAASLLLQHNYARNQMRRFNISLGQKSNINNYADPLEVTALAAQKIPNFTSASGRSGYKKPNDYSLEILEVIIHILGVYLFYSSLLLCSSISGGGVVKDLLQ